MRPSSPDFERTKASGATGGAMRKALRRPAMAIVALMLAAAFGCSARGPSSSPRQTAQAASSPAVLPSASPAILPAGTARVTQAAFNEDADGARVVLSADAPLLYTAYEPRPDLLVVDLPGADLSSGFAPPSGAGMLVTSIRFEPVLEMGKRLTRVSLSHRPGVRSDVRTAGLGLAISFEPPAETANRSEALPEVPATPTAEAASPIVVEEIPPPARQSQGELAHQLEDLRVIVGSSQEVTVALLGDGVFAPKDFLLENPPRLVIDLPGVKNQVRRRVVPVKSALVSRVRVSQFQSLPDPVTRVVLDLVRPLPHSLVSEGERLAVLVRAGEVAQAVSSSPSETRIAEPAASASPPPEERLVRKEEASAVKPEPIVPSEDVPRRLAPEPPNSSPAPPAAATTTSESPVPLSAASPEGSLQPAPVRASAVSENAGKLPPGVRKAQKST